MTERKILNPRHQAIRTMLASMDDTRFATLKASLEQSRAVIDARIAVLEGERSELELRKQQLDVLLDRFGKPAALDTFRSTLIKGDRLSVSAKPASAEAEPAKRPARRRTPATRRGGTGPRG